MTDQREWQIAQLAAGAVLQFGPGRRNDAIEAARQVVNEWAHVQTPVTPETWVDAQLEVVHRMKAAGVYLGRPDADARRAAWIERNNGAQLRQGTVAEQEPAS